MVETGVMLIVRAPWTCHSGPWAVWLVHERKQSESCDPVPWIWQLCFSSPKCQRGGSSIRPKRKMGDGNREASLSASGKSNGANGGRGYDDYDHLGSLCFGPGILPFWSDPGGLRGSSNQGFHSFSSIWDDRQKARLQGMEGGGRVRGTILEGAREGGRGSRAWHVGVGKCKCQCQCQCQCQWPSARGIVSASSTIAAYAPCLAPRSGWTMVHNLKAGKDIFSRSVLLPSFPSSHHPNEPCSTAFLSFFVTHLDDYGVLVIRRLPRKKLPVSLGSAPFHSKLHCFYFLNRKKCA